MADQPLNRRKAACRRILFILTLALIILIATLEGSIPYAFMKIADSTFGLGGSFGTSASNNVGSAALRRSASPTGLEEFNFFHPPSIDDPEVFWAGLDDQGIATTDGVPTVISDSMGELGGSGGAAATSGNLALDDGGAFGGMGGSVVPIAGTISSFLGAPGDTGLGGGFTPFQLGDKKDCSPPCDSPDGGSSPGSNPEGNDSGQIPPGTIPPGGPEGIHGPGPLQATIPAPSTLLLLASSLAILIVLARAGYLTR